MHVYVIASDGGMCKIGKADDPISRMATFFTGHPYKMKLVYQRPHAEPYLVESAAHKALAEKRMSGEWFNVDYMTAVETIERIVSDWKPSANVATKPQRRPVISQFCLPRIPDLPEPCGGTCDECRFELGCESPHGPPTLGQLMKANPNFELKDGKLLAIVKEALE